MNKRASQLFAEGFLQGFWGTVGLMLSVDAEAGVPEVEELPTDGWGDVIAKYTGIVSGRVQDGGAVALLFRAADMAAISSGVMGGGAAAKATIDEEDIPGYREVFEPCLGGGLSFFKETYDRELPLVDVHVGPFNPDAAGAAMDLLGDDVIAASFPFAVPPSVDSKAVLLFSMGLESNIPLEALGESDSASAGNAGTLSQEELDRILNTVGLDDASGADVYESGVPAEQKHRDAAPSNFDMVLDIRLVATARLGRVEMPVSQILGLGPGSIIEVGHMVDEPVELLINNKLIARGDVVVVDEKFALRITEIVSTKERIESLR